MNKSEVEQMSFHEKLAAEFEWEPTYWDSEHQHLKDMWLQRVSMEAKDGQGNFTSPFKTHEIIFRKYFQLDVWITNVRLDDSHVSSYWAHNTMQCSRGANATLGYISFPSNEHKVFDFDFTDLEYDDRSIDAQSGAALKINVPEALSQSQRARFQRMVKVLGFKPPATDTQQTSLLSDHGKSGKGLEVEVLNAHALSWVDPQLMVLLRHDISF